MSCEYLQEPWFINFYKDLVSIIICGEAHFYFWIDKNNFTIKIRYVRDLDCNSFFFKACESLLELQPEFQSMDSAKDYADKLLERAAKLVMFC